MNPNWTSLQAYLPEVTRQCGGLSTPPPIDYQGRDAGGNAASTRAEDLPEEFFRLNEVAGRGDLDLVQSIFESERLPNTPMERLENEKLVPIMHRALLKGRARVVAYLLSQGVPLEMVQVEIAIQRGMHSLL